MDEQIMKLPVGTQIEEKIVSAMWDISGVQQPRMAFSRDTLAALGLRDFAADAFGTVCLMKCGDGPTFISEICIIQDEEDHRVQVITSDWKESLAKAFLLFNYGFYGEYQDLFPAELSQRLEAALWVH